MNLSREMIEKGNNKFLLSSKEPYLVIEFTEKLRNLYPEYSYKMCMDLDPFLEQYHRGGMFSDSPMILCLWEITAESLKELSPLVCQPTQDILIFVERKVLAKNKLYTNFKAECYPITLDPLNEKDCHSWVSGRMISNGLNFNRDLVKILVEKKSNNLYALDSEIRKLKVIFGEREIGVSAAKYIAESSEARIFEFMEHLFHKRKDKALQEFYKFPEDEYIKLVSSLLSSLERTYKIAVYKSQNKTPDDIASLVGINKFIIKTKYFTVISVYNKIKLLKLIDIFNDLDYNLRLSPLPKKLLFEAYLLKAFCV
jgi:DNA polymerase III delta subunit